MVLLSLLVTEINSEGFFEGSDVDMTKGWVHVGEEFALLSWLPVVCLVGDEVKAPALKLNM